MLTGECKLNFEHWLIEKDICHCNSVLYTNIISYGFSEVETFNDLPFVMRYGVYVDFFDFTGLEIVIEPYFDFQKDLLYKVCIPRHKDINEQNSYTKREYARESAIEQANKIYNND